MIKSRRLNKKSLLSHHALGIQPQVQSNAQEYLRTPLYHQIYLVLRQMILDGELQFGDRLPGEQELMHQYEVSRITAQRAVNELAREGLVVRERGRGTRVVRRLMVPPIFSPTQGLLDNLQLMGKETQARLLEFNYVPAPPEAAAALGLAGEGLKRSTKRARLETVQRAVRVRSVEGVPFSHLTTFVPEDIGRMFSEDDLASQPMLSLLEQSGVRISSATQTLGATLADSRIALSLGVVVGSALLQLRRVVRDDQQRPVEYLIALYNPAHYQYRMAMSRTQGKTSKGWTSPGEISS